MKRLRYIGKHTLHSLCQTPMLLIAAVLFSLASSSVLASEHNATLEPMNALPSSKYSTTGANTKPLLLLAQAATSKAEAAQLAKSRHGGKVLSVRKSGNGWQVKLLLDDGRVKLVYVEGSGQGK